MNYRIYLENGSLIFQAHDTFYVISRVRVSPGFLGLLVALILLIVWWYFRRKN